LIIIVRDGFFQSDDIISDQELLFVEISGQTQVGHMLRVTHNVPVKIEVSWPLSLLRHRTSRMYAFIMSFWHI